MSSISFNRKACATCEYWGGLREVDSFGSHAKCGSYKVVGICNNHKSAFKKKETKCDYGGCGKWQKWALLTKMK